MLITPDGGGCSAFVDLLLLLPVALPLLSVVVITLLFSLPSSAVVRNKEDERDAACQFV
jgi:hypothetical protein